MEGKEENGGDCGDDDEWGNLITTPNRLISDEFFILKAEKMGNGEEDEQQLEQEQESRVCSDGRSRRVSIAERRAAKCGSDADASGINVPVSSSPAVSWSQLLTIPSGISPTSLLDCPMMLPNSQASPTTGTMAFPPPNHEIFGMNSEVEDGSYDNGSFVYGPPGGSLLWPCISDLQNQVEFPGALLKETVAKSSTAALDSSKAPKTTIQNTNGASIQPSQTDNQTPPIKQSTQAYQKDTNLANMRNSEDGYNWRKYGQKQVKGSEYPRSYYKCTHPNCQVKKKVERSHDGHITEIIYKGAHNHQIPHLGQRNIIGSPSSVNGTSQIGEANGSYIKMEDHEVWGNNNITDGLERATSTSVHTDNSDLILHTHGKSMAIFDSIGNPELSSSNANSDVNDDGTNIGTLSPGDEAQEDKSDLKRRKKGNFLLETSLVSRAMREPRVVVQIESDVDILDDGYRWRKYGQKVVKGNPNPRSYYKCTSAGCPVRKHVERASDDLKAVLTTYEGKHNHEVPAARNSTHANLDVSNTPNISLPRITNVPKPETQVQDLPLRFDRKLTNEYIPSNFVASFDTEPTKFEASSIYQTKFLPLQSPMPFGSIAPGLPDFPISVPPRMVHTGFGFNNNAKRVCEAPPFIGGQRFIKPKLEQDDSFYDSRCCRMIPHFPS